MQTGYSSPRWPRHTLIALAWFQLLSAIGGAVGLISGGIVEMGMPLSILDGSIFADFFWPGIILGIIVGGTQLLALVAQYRRYHLAWGLHAVAGFTMLIWIFIETGIIGGQSFLQVLYFGTGLVQCIAVMLVLGIWPVPFWGREETRH